MTGNRFDYVKYDNEAVLTQEVFKEQVKTLEVHIEQKLKSPRAKALALTKLEEVYMWIGKGVRDDQIARSGTAELQEQRKDN